MLFNPLYHDVRSLISVKIIQTFHLLLGFAENQGVIRDFKIQNSVRITEDSNNGDSDNRGLKLLYLQLVISLTVMSSWKLCFPWAANLFFGCCTLNCHPRSPNSFEGGSAENPVSLYRSQGFS